MTTDEIKLLFEYHYWAVERIFAMSAKVSPELFVAPTSDGYGSGSLRALLLHIVDTELQWRLTFTGFYATPISDAEYEATELTEAEFPTLNAIEERWQVEQQQMWAYITALSDEQINGTIRYALGIGIMRERVLWHCLLHVVNHGTQHRSETAVLLTRYGQSPGDLDFTQFLNERFNLPS